MIFEEYLFKYMFSMTNIQFLEAILPLKWVILSNFLLIIVTGGDQKLFTEEVIILVHGHHSPHSRLQGNVEFTGSGALYQGGFVELQSVFRHQSSLGIEPAEMDLLLWLTLFGCEVEPGRDFRLLSHQVNVVSEDQLLRVKVGSHPRR